MLACEYHIKDKCDYGYEVRENRFECAKEIAVHAIEKQIPKKPQPTKEGYLACECGLVIQVKNKRNCIYYCHNCGQRIEW